MELLNQIIESLKQTGADEATIQNALQELYDALGQQLNGGNAQPQEEEMGEEEIEAKKAEVFGA